MRKYIVTIAVFMSLILVIGTLYAQSPRNKSIGDSEGKTTLTNISITGLDVTGVPSYIEMTNGSGDFYYLYVSTTGNLMIATPGLVGTTASPNMTNWNNYGAKVGAQ